MRWGPSASAASSCPLLQRRDAGRRAAIAASLGANLIELPIVGTMEAYERSLADSFAGTEPGITEENLQARIRGNLLMALLEQVRLVLTTATSPRWPSATRRSTATWRAAWP